MALQKVLVLGSTGSIGQNTLAVLSLHPERFEVFALTAHKQIDLLFEQCLAFRPRFIAVEDKQACTQLKTKLAASHLETQLIDREDALTFLASHEEVDIVMAAIVGAAGLEPALAAARSGKRLLLANKEALVIGGDLLLDAIKQGKSQLIPIDSEHSAIFQCLPPCASDIQKQVDHITLTASGGPFRTLALSEFSSVTPEAACAHPNWSMGRKISVDSATMMNKALEIIEAHYLFGLAPENIKVVIHLQSIVHSMVHYRDGSVIAQLGTADMRVPISYGLAWPDRITSGASTLDFTKSQNLSFEPVDLQRYPGLALAWEALAAPFGTTTVLNAANEVAVAAFLNSQIRFTDIHTVNLEVLEAITVTPCRSVEELLELDTRARARARKMLAEQSLPLSGGG